MVKAKEQVPKVPRVQERARKIQLAKVLQGGELSLQGRRMLEAWVANRVALLRILVRQSPHLGGACLVGFSEALVMTAKELKGMTGSQMLPSLKPLTKMPGRVVQGNHFLLWVLQLPQPGPESQGQQKFPLMLQRLTPPLLGSQATV